jgi:hypothetical protein
VEPRLLRIFQEQVQFQVECVFAACKQIDAALNLADVKSTFFGIQNLLVATGNIAKALWGQNGNAGLVAARKPLRDSIGVTDDSPLKIVLMRNHFEHFDERLDKWWQRTDHRRHMDMNIGPIGMQFVPPFSELEKFRSYNQETGILEFWGDTFDLGAVMAEIRRVARLLQAELDKPAPEA